MSETSASLLLNPEEEAQGASSYHAQQRDIHIIYIAGKEPDSFPLGVAKHQYRWREGGRDQVGVGSSCKSMGATSTSMSSHLTISLGGMYMYIIVDIMNSEVRKWNSCRSVGPPSTVYQLNHDIH